MAAPALRLALYNNSFTLLVKSYDEVRRAVTLLRWREKDADSIAPSLYAGRGGRGRSATEHTDSPKSDLELPAPPAVDPDAPTPAAPGMPGASPFVTS